MSNNSLNHNTPGNSGNDDPGLSSHDSPGSSNNDDPGPSSHDLPGSSNNDDSGPSSHDSPGSSINDDPGPSSHDSPGSSNNDNPKEPEVPFVSRYGMEHAMNSLQDVEFYRATLFNLKTEPVEDRERRSEEASRLFIQQCWEREEIDFIDEQAGDLLPEETVIKSEPIDEIEENTSLLYMETEPLDYLPESYSESMENSSHIDAINSGGNEINNTEMCLQQLREQGVEINEIDNLLPENSSYIDETGPRANEFEGAGMYFQQFTNSEEEMDEINNLSPENSSYIDETSPRGNEFEGSRMYFRQLTDSAEEDMDEIDNLSTENSSYTDEINTIGYEMEGDGMCLQELRDSEEEMDETDNNIQLVVPPVLPVPLEPEEINERNTQLVVPEAIVLSNTMTETPPPIDTITNPRANEIESNGMFLQQLRDSEEEMDETDNNIQLVVSPVLPVPLEPEEINERNTQLVVPEAIVLSNTMTETPSPIDTITNPRENEFESNGMFLQQLRDSEEEMDQTDNNIQLVVSPVLPVPLEPEEINERNTQLVVPEAIVLSNTMTETPPPIDTITNPRENEFESNGMFIQQLRDSEEEMDETDNNIQLVVPPVLPVPMEPEEINERNTQLVVPEAIVLSNTMTETPPPIDTITDPRENDFESIGMFLQQLRDSEEEMDETDNNIQLVVPPVLPVPMEPEEINERNTQLVVPEAIVLSNTMTETPPPIDTITDPRENDFESNGMFLQQLRDSEEEMDETDNNIQLVVPPVLPVPLEPEEINERNTQLVVPEAIVLSNTMTETPPPIDTITNPRANEIESNGMFLQQLRDSEEEMDETDNNIQLVVSPVLPVPLEPEEINERNTQLVVPEAIVLSNTMTETPPSIDTITNPRASDLDNGITNTIENPASVQRRTRKKKDVILTPTRVSTRIKKPRIMYNI